MTIISEHHDGNGSDHNFDVDLMLASLHAHYSIMATSSGTHVDDC